MEENVKWRSAVAVLAGLSVAALLLTVLLPRSARQSVFRSLQPDSVAYHSYDPYLLTVEERGLDWTTFPLSRRHQIFIGRAADLDHGYGYRLDYSFHPQLTAEQTDASRVQVVWTTAGVTLTEKSGQRLFIPQTLFTGGR